MSGQNTAFILEKAKNSVIEDVASDVSVDGAERIVHEYDVGIEVNSSGNVETLLPRSPISVKSPLGSISISAWRAQLRETLVF
jgi:hypothetical protein